MPKRMGRPPLNLKTTVIRLSAETIARIEAVAGKNRMSQFMREAAEAELARREAETGHKPPLSMAADKAKKKRKG
jgi:predicted DNA-binding protein